MVADMTQCCPGGEKRMKKGAWMIFFILAMGFFFSYFIRLSSGVLGPMLMKDLNLDVGQLGLLASSFFYAFALCQLPVGIALDSFRPKRVILVTLLPAIVGCALFAMASNFSMIFWGMSSIFMGSLKIFGNWFPPDQFAFLSGIMLSVGNLGAYFSSTPLVVAASTIGWRQCFWGFALYNTLLFVAVLFFVRDQPEKATLPLLPAAEAESSSPIGKRLSSLKIVFFDRNFMFISLAAFIRYGSLISIQGFLGTLYLINIIGYSYQKAGHILSMIAIGYLIGSPLLGRMSDRIFKSRKRIMVWGLLIYSFLFPFFLFDLDSDLLWYVIFFALGFFSSIGAVSFTHVKELFPREMSGVVLTANNLFNIGGVAVSQHFVGMIVALYPAALTINRAAAYHAAFAVLFAFSILAFFMYLFVKDSQLLAVK
jgi:sugar phosphate permease